MNRRSLLYVLLALLVFTLSAGSAMAAKTKPKPKAKPKAKAVATTHHETVGTKQLTGEDGGQIGHTYTLGKENPWNVKLNKVEYTINTVQFGDTICYPSATEKIIVLHYTMHNPQKSEALLRFDTVSITAVDKNNKNYEKIQELGDEASKASVNIDLKPAQKTDVYSAIVVPAEAIIDKIIFKSGDNLVIRYLKMDSQIKGFDMLSVDPSTMGIPLGTVPAQAGTYYPAGQFDIKLEGMAFSNKAIGDETLEDGQKFLIATFTAKCLDTCKPVLRFDTFCAKAKDADGVDIERVNSIIRASSDKELETNMDRGQEMKFRIYFRIESGIEPKSLVISQTEEGRAYEFPVNP